MKKKRIAKAAKNKVNLQQKGRRSSNNRGLQAKIIRGSKGQKGKQIPFKIYYNYGRSGSMPATNRLGRFVLKAMANARVSAHQIEAARRVVKKFIRKSFKLQIQIYPFAPITKRPSDVRMGKGKGTKIVDWIYPIKAGKTIFELIPKRRRRRSKKFSNYQFLQEMNAVYALQLAFKKFAILTKVFVLKI
jgi:ribosomal protein L16